MSVHALASCLVQAKILPGMYAAHKGYQLQLKRLLQRGRDY